MRQKIWLYLFPALLLWHGPELFARPGCTPSGKIDTIRVADYRTGRTASEAIECVLALRDARRFTVLQLDGAPWMIDRAVELPSRTELLLVDCTLKLSDGVFDNIVRSAGIRPDPGNPYGLCRGLDKTSQVKITGRGRAVIEGADHPHRAAHPRSGEVTEWVGDFYGWRTVGILLAATESYEISGLTIRKTHCWAISQEWGCRGGYLHDLIFDTNVKNGDGIDFRNGCSDMLVENITGSTSDDTIACTALDNTVWEHGKDYYLWPMQTMGYAYRTGRRSGIRRITIRGIHTAGSHHGVICLATSPVVKRIRIEEVEEPVATDRKSCVSLYTGYGKGYRPGNLRRISIDGVISRGARYGVEVTAQVKGVRIGRVEQFNSQGEALCLEKQHLPRAIRFGETQ